MNNKIIEDLIKDDFMLQQIINLHKREFKIILFRDHSLKYMKCKKFRNTIIKLKDVLKTNITMYGPHIINKQQVNSLGGINTLILWKNAYIFRYLNYLPCGIKNVYIKDIAGYSNKIPAVKHKKIQFIDKKNNKIKVRTINLPSSVKNLYIN